MATATAPTSPIHRLAQGLLIGLAAFLLAAVGQHSVFQALEARTFDMRARWFAHASPATDSIRLIFLDQESLDWGKNENGLSWPWMREAYVPILDFCKRAGAHSVVFDVLFTEPSAYSVDDDRALGAAIARNGRYIQAFFPSGSAVPIPEAASNAAILAHARADFDPDGVLRRIRLVERHGDRLIPSLGLAPLLLHQPRPELTLEKGFLRIGSTVVPLDANGAALLRFRGPSQTHAAVNAKAVIQSELQLAAGEKPILDPSFFKDKDVFFGFTAHGLYDLRPTPMGAQYPGVEVHAATLDNLRAGDFLREVPDAVALAAMLFLCLLAGAGIRFVQTARLSGLLLVTLSLIPLIMAGTLYPAGWWMPAVAPEAGVVLALVGGLVVNYAAEGRQKRFIKGAFSQYLSPVVIEQLVRNPERLTLGGEKKPLTILFSDIRGFTGISETLDPQELTALLNAYLTAVTAVIYEEGGTIDKYEGDAVIAFWNAPIEMPDHAARAVRAALRYQEKLRDINPRLKQEFGHELVARIGLNTGPVVIGNMGSAQRFNYTFLGDAGNLASRLEGLNKPFGTPILVSQVTREMAGDEFVFRKIARVAVVGRKEPVTVYQPMRHEDWKAGESGFAAFESALADFEHGDFGAALKALEPLAAQDPVAAHYRRQCDYLLRNPPPAWNGTWILTEK